MIAQAAVAMRPPRALCPPSRAAVRPALSFRWPAITLGVGIPCRKAVSGLKLATGTFAWAAVALAIMNYQEHNRDIVVIEPIRNETVVLRDQEQAYTQTEHLEASGEDEGNEHAIPWNYPRAVQTVRFVNPGAPSSIGTKGEVYTIRGPTNVPGENRTYRAEGIASWYGPDFHGRRTANGERYDMHGISAAHRTMPLPSYARVTNLDNGRSIIVRVNNRGPFVHNRIVDLSVGTAKALDCFRKGTARVRVEFVGRAPIEGSDDQMLLATLRAGTPAPAPSQVMVASAKPPLPKGSDGKELQLRTEP